MSSKTAKPKPMNYGPYKIEPPSGSGPLPMWHARGPALDMASTSEDSVRRAAIEHNAAYQAGLKAGESIRADLLAACKAALAAVEANAERYPGDREAQRDANLLRSAIARGRG